MISQIREKWGPVVVGLIIGLLAFVFMFFGIDPMQGGGGVAGNVAGEVNGERISAREYTRAVERYKDNMRNRGLPEEQIAKLGVERWAFDELSRRLLLKQAAEKQGVMPSEQQVRETIAELPYFRKDGQFDPLTYKELLKANRMTPAGFEENIRQDLLDGSWREYFKTRVFVSKSEIENEFVISNDLRKIKYVVLTPDIGRKNVKISAKEVKDFLAQEEKKALVKSRYELSKATKYKDKKLEDVENQIAREVLKSEKTEEAQKFNDQLAEKVLAAMGTSKSAERKVNGLLKKFDVKVESSREFSRRYPYIPGIGDAEELVKDAFKIPSPIDPKNGGKPVKYSTARGLVIAVLEESKPAEVAKMTAEERADIRKRLRDQKENRLYGAWLKELREKSKILKNPEIFGEKTETASR